MITKLGATVFIGIVGGGRVRLTEHQAAEAGDALTRISAADFRFERPAGGTTGAG